jgi:hypothetical protein
MGSNPILAATGGLDMATTDQVRDFDYTGLHAFVFIDAVDPGRNVADVVEDIGGTEGREFPNGRVLFASVTVGGPQGLRARPRRRGRPGGIAAAHLPGPVERGRARRVRRRGARLHAPGRQRDAQGTQAQEPAVLRPGAGPDRRRPGRGDERRSPAGLGTPTRSRARRSPSGRPTCWSSWPATALPRCAALSLTS